MKSPQFDVSMSGAVGSLISFAGRSRTRGFEPLPSSCSKEFRINVRIFFSAEYFKKIYVSIAPQNSGIKMNILTPTTMYRASGTVHVPLTIHILLHTDYV